MSSKNFANGIDPAATGFYCEISNMLKDKDTDYERRNATALVDTDQTVPASEDHSALVGWDAGQQTASNSRLLSSNIVQSTRVGGATFVRSNAAVASSSAEQIGQTTVTPQEPPHRQLNSVMNKRVAKPVYKQSWSI